jgi:hypothetical protein
MRVTRSVAKDVEKRGSKLAKETVKKCEIVKGIYE